jgi:hypothetical protein
VADLAVPGAPAVLPTGSVSRPAVIVPTLASNLDELVIESTIFGDVVARRDDNVVHALAVHAPASPTPATPTGPDEKFDINRALYVEEDRSVDPLDPKVTVIKRFPWGTVVRYAIIVVTVVAVAVAGLALWRSHAASSRTSAVRKAAAQALAAEQLSGQVHYVANGRGLTGTIDAQRSPIVQRLQLASDANTNGNPVSMESIWINGNVYIRSVQSAASVGDSWVEVRLASQSDMRTRIDMGRVLGSGTPEPLLPLRVLAAAGERVAEGKAELVNGVAATRYKVLIDTTKIREKDEVDDVRMSVKQYGWTGVVSGDVWIDESGRLLKTEFPYAGGGIATVTFTAGTEKLSITIPSDPVDASTLSDFTAVLIGATS